ncbi:MAG: HesA/MoeB/ThiF family protein [Candidatus Hodarchaeales archaeon]|jgi:molybdopterin/thiamine biosynthesis adenylyltransferase
MKIIIHPSFSEWFDSLKDNEGFYTLHGKIYDNYSVCHISGIFTSPVYPESIGYLTIGNKRPSNSIKIEKKYPFLNAKINSGNIESLKVEIFTEDNVVKSDFEVEIEIIDLNRIFVRIDQIETPLKILSQKKVAIIGMGSGGSLLAVYLAKSGIKNLIFIDDDHLETHNIIRHICDLTQLGRFKNKAVKDYIDFRIPDISITTVEKKFSLHTRTDADFYLDLFKNVDLIVAASGEHTVNFALNDFIHSNKLLIPVLYAGTFDGVRGGLMFNVDPRKDDYCYHCIYSDPTSNGNIKTGSIPATIELEKKITYDRTLEEQIAQPGLGLDIDNLTILLAKFCLDVLLSGHEHGLYHFTENFYMWFNRTVMRDDKTTIKFEGLELCYYEDLEKNPTCPYHSSEAQIKEEEE